VERSAGASSQEENTLRGNRYQNIWRSFYNYLKIKTLVSLKSEQEEIARGIFIIIKLKYI